MSFRWEDEHLVADLPHARAVFTTRRGGVSDGAYASLNLATHVGDEPARVSENRQRLGALVGRPWEAFVQGEQVHGSAVSSGFEEADGRVATDAPAAILAADCLPVLLATEGAVAALHCGYRPLASGLIANGLRAVGDGPVTAIIGPGARGCCYEVGPEVHARFEHGRHGENLDLAEVAIAQLDGAEVLDCGICTICDERFFSYRRDGTTGRHAGVIWRV